MPVAYRHIIYIHFPYLAAIRNQRVTNKTEPLVTIKKIKGIDVVIAGCVKSENFGVVAGMRLADARAICPQIIIKEHDPAADHTDLNHLAIWARRYSPLTGVDKEYGGIWLDIAGSEHLFGGVRGLLADCARWLHRSRLRAVIASAPTCAAAWALAHYGRPSQRLITAFKKFNMTSDMKAHIRCVDLCKYLAPLPILALRIEKATVECMARIGLRSIGDIINLPRAPLAARFGTDVLLRLDQALGNEVETFQPINPPKPLYVYHQFSEPISDSNDIKLMIQYLAKKSANFLEKAGLATRCLRLGWRLVDGQFFTHDVHLSLPSRDMTLFSRLLSDVNNKIDPGFGIEMSWIETLDCIPLAPFETELVHLNSQGRVKIARDAYVNLIDRLVARLGRGAIMRLVPKEFWQPEAAQSFEFPDPDQLFLESDKRVKWLCSLNRKTTPPRPIRLLAHPQPVDVIVLSEEYRPIRFIWQRRAHKVVHSTGPERIAPAWWKAPKGTRTRDYFWLRDDQGAGFWLYCEGLTERNEIPVWFLHGFFA